MAESLKTKPPTVPALLKTEANPPSAEQAAKLEAVGSSRVAKKGAKSRFQRQEMWWGYLFISPVVIGYLLFLLGPIVAVFVLSLTSWSLFDTPQFIGLDNYTKALSNDPTFWTTVGNTLYFTLGLVPLNLALALALALLLNRKLPGIGLFRTIIFTPVVTSIVVWAIIWKYIFATDAGLVNQLLQLVGIQGPAWLYSENWTMPVVIIVSVLKNVGLNMVLFLAALQNVPSMYYEAARLDGAGRWQMFTNVTLPLISPTLFLTGVLTVIGSLKVFGQIYVLTGGGPGTSTHVLVFYIYKQAFKFFEYGYASALAFLLFLVVLALTLLQWQLRKKWVLYED